MFVREKEEWRSGRKDGEKLENINGSADSHPSGQGT